MVLQKCKPFGSPKKMIYKPPCGFFIKILIENYTIELKIMEVSAMNDIKSLL